MTRHRLIYIIAALLFTLGVILPALSFVVEADGQTLKRGVGVPGVPEGFSRYWCEQLKPPGRDATATVWAPEGFNKCPRQGWLGHFAERFPYTEVAITRAWEADLWGTKGQYDGRWTDPERDWVMVTTPMASDLYRTYWYPTWWGGSPDNPVVIATDFDVKANEHFIWASKELGAWRPGLFSYRGFNPSPGRWEKGGFWPVWVDNRLPPDHPANGGPEEPEEPEPEDPEPDDPEPDPDPEDPECDPCPEPPPLCRGDCQNLAETVERALSGQRRTILPNGTGEVDEDGRWQFIPTWLRSAIEAMIVRCNADRPCFRPTEASTGVLSLETAENPKEKP